jgi:transposase
MRGMPALRKYPEELRGRAVRFCLDLMESSRLSVTQASDRVGEQLGVNPATLRNWVKRARVDAHALPGVTTDEKARLVELEREIKELRRANEILRTASAFFAAAELDRKIR